MEIVNFLAQFWGFSLIVISFGFLINPRNKEHLLALMEDHKNVTLFGIINVMLGVVFVLLYNVWGQHWQVILTILGWLVFARGVICLFFPEIVKKGVTKLRTQKDLFSYIFVGCIIVGCLLVYLGQNF